MTRSGTWLIDVRPEPLIGDKDAESFAAAAEAALACGWRYTVAARWREHVLASLDALSSQRRPLSDPLGLRPGLLAAAGKRGARFGEVAAASGCEPVARAQLLHLIWHRQVGIDLAGPLGGPVAAGPGSAAVRAETVLELTAGTEIVLDGREWTVERREPHLGLRPPGQRGRRPPAGQPAVPGLPPGLLAVVADRRRRS